MVFLKAGTLEVCTFGLSGCRVTRRLFWVWGPSGPTLWGTTLRGSGLKGVPRPSPWWRDGQAKRLKHQFWPKSAWPTSATQILAKVGQLRLAKVGQKFSAKVGQKGWHNSIWPKSASALHAGGDFASSTCFLNRCNLACPQFDLGLFARFVVSIQTLLNSIDNFLRSFHRHGKVGPPGRSASPSPMTL